MSLHARWQQRIASTSAHRTVWRRRCVRYYASDTASDPEWFQKVRDELLGRRPRYHPEELDPTHYDQFNTTLNGFEPSTVVRTGTSKVRVPLAELLTRFNVRVQSAELLDDGTDPFHFPGEPWIRRMWAGGAVKVKPGRGLGAKAGTVTPFRLKETVACLERIKDVRLQGTGDEAKIYVTIERCFALDSASNVESGRALQASDCKRVRLDPDWSESPVTEERNLVFMRPKKGLELASGSSSGDTRYLKAPKSPDYSHSVTPTRSLLFRYSAITYNAHLIHLDPTYARDVEGHRNILVHGPLTLTLMLQVLNKHLKPMLESITSIEYRNIAPLYCDEEMRICVKKKKQTDTEHSWDVWIEGPTGGMAVKAVAHSIDRSAGALHRTSPNRVEATASADLPDVETVAAQAQDTLHALNQGDAGKAQLSQVTREERRQLIKHVLSDSAEISHSAVPKPYLEFTPFSRQWRKQQIGKALRYLYMDWRSPLINHDVVERQIAPSSAPLPSAQKSREERRLQNPGPLSYSARKQWIGNSLPYLYAHSLSPLLNNDVVERTVLSVMNPETETQTVTVTERTKTSESTRAVPERTSGGYIPSSSQHRQERIGTALPYLYADTSSPLTTTAVVAQQTQSRAPKKTHRVSPFSPLNPRAQFGVVRKFLSGAGVISTRSERGIETQEWAAARKREKAGVRALRSGDITPGEEETVLGFLNTGNLQDEREISRLAAERKTVQQEGSDEELRLRKVEELRLKKVEGFRIREIGSTSQASFRAAERRRAHEMAVSEGKKRREEREGREARADE